MFAFAIFPSIAQLIGMWSLPQSPRYAFEKDGIETCEKVGIFECKKYECCSRSLNKSTITTRNGFNTKSSNYEPHTNGASKIERCIKVSNKKSPKRTEEREWKPLKFHLEDAFRLGSNVVYRVFGTPHVLKAVLIGCALQIFQQTSGVNTIEYFINNLFKAAGIEGDNDSLWLAVGPSGKIS